MIKIKKSDTISGSFYMKLVNSYKDYDKRQKKYIQSLIKENEELKAEIETLNMLLEPSDVFIKDKIKNYKIIITNLTKKITSLKNKEL